MWRVSHTPMKTCASIEHSHGETKHARGERNSIDALFHSFMREGHNNCARAKRSFIYNKLNNNNQSHVCVIYFRQG